MAGRVFRHMEKVRAIGADGSVATGRGAVVRWKGAAGDALGALRHEIGILPQPMYVFTGDLPQVQPGDLLEQGGEQYAVLHISRMMLGSSLICTRAVLEKRGAADDSL